MAPGTRRFRDDDEEASNHRSKQARLGTSLSNPIILGDSPPSDGPVVVEDDGDEPVAVGNDGMVMSFSAPTALFYQRNDRGANEAATPFRSLAVIKEDQLGDTRLLKICDGWPPRKRRLTVKLFLEGLRFARRDTRYRHVEWAGDEPPDLSTLNLGLVRRKICEHFNIDDTLSLHLEVQPTPTTIGSPIFTRGSCTRPCADWTNISVTDNTPLSEALPSADAWLRVYVAEYIRLEVTLRNLSLAITPPADATMSSVRNLAASALNTTPDVVHMFSNELELYNDMGYLQFLEFKSGDTIRVALATRECANCFDDATVNEFPFEPITDECTHDLNVCNSCVRTWIETCLDNGNWSKISCLGENCEGILQYADIKRAASEADMIRYERFATRDTLAEMEGFKWCIAPGCDSGQVHDNESGDEIIFICTHCGVKQCSQCSRAWHPDETCQQYTDRLAAQPNENAASEAFIATNCKKCPGCQSPIQKTEGCDHMTCRNCRRQFCWLCSADYTDIHRQGNTAHAPNCTYHSGNIVDPHAPPHHRLGRFNALPRIIPPGGIVGPPPPAPAPGADRGRNRAVGQQYNGPAGFNMLLATGVQDPARRAAIEQVRGLPRQDQVQGLEGLLGQPNIPAQERMALELELQRSRVYARLHAGRQRAQALRQNVAPPPNPPGQAEDMVRQQMILMQQQRAAARPQLGNHMRHHPLNLAHANNNAGNLFQVQAQNQQMNNAFGLFNAGNLPQAQAQARPFNNPFVPYNAGNVPQAQPQYQPQNNQFGPFDAAPNFQQVPAAPPNPMPAQGQPPNAPRAQGDAIQPNLPDFDFLNFAVDDDDDVLAFFR